MLAPLFLKIKHRRDIIARRNVRTFEINARIEQTLNKNCTLHIRKKQQKALTNLCTTRVKNICIWSGRCRGLVYNGFSRHAMKFFGTRGRWLGLRKSSW